MAERKLWRRGTSVMVSFVLVLVLKSMAMVSCDFGKSMFSLLFAWASLIGAIDVSRLAANVMNKQIKKKAAYTLSKASRERL